MVTILDWLRDNVTTDGRALAWFEGGNSERRIARAYRELLSGYEVDPSTILNTTRPVTDQHDGLVTVRDISFVSLCAHHLLPFFGTVDITYQPGDRIIGLGKFPRLVKAYARRFQIQEDLVRDIALQVAATGGARAILVNSRARHLCICGRGPNEPNAITEASYSVGATALFPDARLTK